MPICRGLSRGALPLLALASFREVALAFRTNDALEEGELLAVAGEAMLNQSLAAAAAYSAEKCPAGMKVVFDNIKAANPTCTCECDEADPKCRKASCPTGYHMENNKCLRTDEIHHEATEKVHESLECADEHRTERANGTAGKEGPVTCYYDCDCPDSVPDKSHHYIAACQCTYEAACAAPYEDKVINGKHYCTTPDEPAWEETVREDEELIIKCPEGYALEGDDCAKYTDYQVEAVPPSEHELLCPDGKEPEVCGDKRRCYDEIDCDESMQVEGAVVKACERTMILDCPEPTELHVDGSGKAMCTFAGIEAHTKTEREAVEATRHCPEGYDILEHGCVRYYKVQHEMVPGAKEPLKCLKGGSTKSKIPPKDRTEKVGCFTDCKCPEAPDGRSVGACECNYNLKCNDPLKLIKEGGKPFCHQESKDAWTELVHMEGGKVYSCPDGSKLNTRTGKCVGPAECPPVAKIELNQEAMGCGPNTDAYIERMFRQLYATAMLSKRYGLTHKYFSSCSTNCISIFSKFSECAYQNDPGVCVGRAGRSGKAIRPIRSLSSMDECKGDNYKAVKWLRGTPACKDAKHNDPWLRKSQNKAMSAKAQGLPCKDMYGSEAKFQSQWAEAVKLIQGIAKDAYIDLSGSYVHQPTGRMDCRQAYCKKAEEQSAYSVDKTGARSLASCIQTCAERYPR